jgi:hypothetical protein
VARWNTHDEIREHSNATGRCPICDKRRAAGYACMEHDKEWQEYGRDHLKMPEGTYAEYVEWVNATYERENGLQCAGCDNRCPKDDYLCSTCRSAS